MISEIVATNFFILFGLVFLIFGCVAEKFYWGRGVYGGDSSNKLMPKWAGRVLFIGIGTAFILFGFAHLFFGSGRFH